MDASDAAAIRRVPGAWDARLARTTHVRAALEGARLLAAPRGPEACGARLDTLAGPGWVAAGDAALSFDPLSSQGIFTVLYTGMKAGDTVLAALSGEPRAVETYAARLESIRSAYLRQHRSFSRVERRWTDEPFGGAASSSRSVPSPSKNRHQRPCRHCWPARCSRRAEPR